MPRLHVKRDPRGVARVTLARPEVLNAFDELMIADLTAAFISLGNDATVRIVVLAAEGRAFCAGADLRWMQRQSTNTLAQNLSDAQTFANLLRIIYECPKVTLARVSGDAYGGGMGLIAATDIALSTHAAQFSISEARFGIVPAVIGPYLVQTLGARQAKRLALTTQTFSASEAQALGLIHDVVRPDQLDATVEQEVKRLLQSAPSAVAEIKQLYRTLATAPITEETCELTAQTIARVRATDEAREGFAAFFERRRAGWMPQ